RADARREGRGAARARRGRARRVRARLADRDAGRACERRRARRAATGRASGARLRRGGPAAGRDRRSRLGGPRRRGRLPARAAAVTADLVYGRRATREALRGRREVLELFASERALRSEPWLREGP